MTRRSPVILTGRRRASVAALLVVLAALCGLGVPRAAAVEAVGHGGGPTPTGEDPVGQWPLRPRPEVVQRFDPPDAPWGAGHRGVDLLGQVGQAVYAALPGRITFAGVLAGRGVIVVDHGSTRTTYEPVAAGVRVGAEVAAGRRIGTLAVIQSHCFPRACLHWGWIDNSTDAYLDPLRLVGAPQPVRLLPLWRAAPAAPSLSPLRRPAAGRRASGQE